MANEYLIEDVVRAAVVGLSFMPAVAWTSAGLALLTNRATRGAAGERRLSGLLDRLGLEHLDDFILERADGSLTQIDHAVRLPDAIAVIETKNWTGRFVVPWEVDADTWEKLDEYNEPVPLSEEGDNPFRQNEVHARAVRATIDRAVPVFNVVCVVGKDSTVDVMPPEDMGLWSGDCWTLSEDRPMAYDLEDFEEVIAELAAAEENPEVDAAWAILKEAARTDRASRRRHARQVNSPDHLGNRVIDAAVLIGFGACLAVAAGAFWNWQLGLNWFGLNRLDPNWLGLNWF